MGLSLGEALLISLAGFTVVLVMLALLAVATTSISKIINVMFADKSVPRQPNSAPAAAIVEEPSMPTSTEDEGEVLALLHGALSLASGIPVDQMAVVSVTSVSDPEKN